MRYADMVFEALGIQIEPTDLDAHETASLEAWIGSFLRGGGQFTFSEWSSMHPVTQDAVERANVTIARERAILACEVQVEMIAQASEEEQVQALLDAAAEAAVQP